MTEFNFLGELFL